jgi:hypothetical protein
VSLFTVKNVWISKLFPDTNICILYCNILNMILLNCTYFQTKKNLAYIWLVLTYLDWIFVIKKALEGDKKRVLHSFSFSKRSFISLLKSPWAFSHKFPSENFHSSLNLSNTLYKYPDVLHYCESLQFLQPGSPYTNLAQHNTPFDLCNCKSLIPICDKIISNDWIQKNEEEEKI